eukprot:1084819-Amphidinium_carterae.1
MGRALVKTPRPDFPPRYGVVVENVSAWELLQARPHQFTAHLVFGEACFATSSPSQLVSAMVGWCCLVSGRKTKTIL